MWTVEEVGVQAGGLPSPVKMEIQVEDPAKQQGGLAGTDDYQKTEDYF
jgi:hypothetical protein